MCVCVSNTQSINQSINMAYAYARTSQSPLFDFSEQRFLMQSATSE